MLEDLNQFTGSETIYRHWTNRLVYTEGVRYLAENAGAYWLIDAIASYQPQDEPFQVWVLKCEGQGASRKAALTMHPDLPGPEIIRQEIEFTDFVLDEIKLYVEVEGDKTVLLLPSEH